MGFFDIFKSQPPVAHVRIGFPDDFEKTSRVAVQVQGQLPDGMQTWLWDLYYAKILFNLGACEASEGLKSEMERWAEKWAAPALSGMLSVEQIDSDLKLLRTMPDAAETYVVDVIQRGTSWPTIKTHLPARGFQNRGAYSVLAFAGFLIAHDSVASRELPLHILGMRQYYKDVQPFTKAGALLGAPAHAVKQALAMFEKAQQTAARDRVKKRGA